MSTKEEQDGRVEKCRLLLERYRIHMQELHRKLDDHVQICGEDDQTYTALMAQRHEAHVFVNELTKALR
jgi:hypothetical protein